MSKILEVRGNLRYLDMDNVLGLDPDRYHHQF